MPDDQPQSLVTDGKSPPIGQQSVSPQRVAERQTQGKRVDLLDVRSAAEFAEVHAVGAELIPLEQLDPSAAMRGRSDHGGPIYVICKTGSRSARAIEQFRRAGFANVFSVEGGTEAWERDGLPVVRGGHGAISIERQVRIGAGSLVLVGLVIGWFVHPAAYLLSAVIASGLIFAGITDWCGMGMLLQKMPWNRHGT